MKRKILFFIADCVPTEAERKAASEIQGAVFRNGRIKSEFPEACDGVAGLVPDVYTDFPFVGNGGEAPEADKPKAKPGRKPKAETQEPVQTPLIPAETGWKANS